jgi:hypothetical protein
VIGPVLFASDDSPEAVADARAYIEKYRLTRDDVALRQVAGQTLIIANRDCREKLK